ncbi:MAG TPA: fumarylacetoacetate hydrolase family protein [Candidatus Acidoferrum sp.]|jgi:2-dehydro-3-deoxy-D-arabinonate dehydratase|nr:fumarylacetoacetate hydrolase family protein [Candidatus Acidoferrum sp.]
MKICRFENAEGDIKIGLVENDSTIIDLSPTGMDRLGRVLESEDPQAQVTALCHPQLPRWTLSEVCLQAPVDGQEVWAAGVTYLRSKKARMEESDFSATAYDRVYAAERPELFFKSLSEKVAAPGEAVGIRRDARWSVPEPELALVLNSHGRVTGYTIGNDMSSRDIEGENLLYLPQAKIYRHSCALGPWILVGASESDAREWTIAVAIERAGARVFQGETSIGQIKRRFEDLARFLFRSQDFPRGAVLLTGTGIVPPEGFTLKENDVVEIRISGIGVLRNPVAVV